MRIHFLGTSGCVPTKQRNVTSHVIHLDSGAIWMFDCGEGTQRELLSYPHLEPAMIEMIYITHLHGDHVYGLFGLLCTMSQRGRTQTVELIGPTGIRGLIDALGAPTDMRLKFPLSIVELTDHPVDVSASTQCPKMRDTIVHAFPLPHRLRSYGFVLTAMSPGDFVSELAERLGVPFGPLWGKLRRGHSVTLPNGTVVRSDQVMGAPKANKMVFLGDCCSDVNATLPSEGLVGSPSELQPLIAAAQGCDVLVHECTYDRTLAEKAYQYGHSTAQMAGAFAAQVRAKRVILMHFSPRYKKLARGDRPTIQDLIDEAQSECPGTQVVAASDGDSFSTTTP